MDDNGSNKGPTRRLLAGFVIIGIISLLLCLIAGGILVVLGKASARYLAVVPTSSRCRHSVQEILALPEYGLTYPGATVDQVFPPQCVVTLHSAALTATSTYLVAASSADVWAYFDHELLARGWQATISYTWADHRAWQKGDFVIQVGYPDGIRSATPRAWRLTVVIYAGLP